MFDSGWYTCKASNMAGEVNATGFLTIRNGTCTVFYNEYIHITEIPIVISDLDPQTIVHIPSLELIYTCLLQTRHYIAEILVRMTILQTTSNS